MTRLIFLYNDLCYFPSTLITHAHFTHSHYCNFLLTLTILNSFVPKTKLTGILFHPILLPLRCYHPLNQQISMQKHNYF